tara:strand:- start:2851 stop:4104 length:1254 start_codon:yes stop_codon:yes gene_type:complete
MNLKNIILINIICLVSANRIFFEDNISLDIILLFTVFIISIITTIGGVGGGGLLIPTYLLVGKFDLKYAIPLSVVTILGDTLIRVIKLFSKKHPLNNKRFLINLTPILILVPFDGNTSFIGLILSKTTPPIFTIILIIFTLGFTFYKSISKAIKVFLKENIYLEDENKYKLVMIDGIGEYFDNEEFINLENDNQVGDSFYEQIIKCSFLLLIIILISVFSITRNLIDKCSSFYWLQILLQFIIVGLLGYMTTIYISNDYNNKKNLNFAFLKGDIVWDNKNIIKFVIIASITGFLSTYMGIGGGMLVTPIMIQVGMIPEVVVATCSISTLFSSIISCVNYIIEGNFLWKYGISFAISSALGSIVGLKLSDYILNKFKRQSIIIFIVSLILFTSIILLTYNSIVNYNVNDFNFNNFCDS